MPAQLAPSSQKGPASGCRGKEASGTLWPEDRVRGTSEIPPSRALSSLLPPGQSMTQTWHQPLADSDNKFPVGVAQLYPTPGLSRSRSGLQGAVQAQPLLLEAPGLAVLGPASRVSVQFGAARATEPVCFISFNTIGKAKAGWGAARARGRKWRDVEQSSLCQVSASDS